jgi:hypothetical protein
MFGSGLSAQPKLLLITYMTLISTGNNTIPDLHPAYMYERTQTGPTPAAGVLLLPAVEQKFQYISN